MYYYSYSLWKLCKHLVWQSQSLTGAICEVPWPCNDRHQRNILLLYTQVQLPFLSTSAGIYCKSADL